MSGLFKDLVGDRFTRLKVIERVDAPSGYAHHDRAYWRCLCMCGKEIIERSDLLVNGNTKSCGCLRNDNLSKVNFVDMTGKRFGYLTVEARAERPAHVTNQSVYWSCRCVCGHTVVKSGGVLRNGRYKDHCGCKD
ncbi:hypothetical protein [Vibrio barjaei]|uniref:hypothetical protein n=1 Tax=Vibrio barjaei TaxID=1676683 RepID=UPI0022840A86|nr:hypothetical protein [Vibrio barjaei]MCY9870439.1 hypothetical protein [Vibrio barjaei]